MSARADLAATGRDSLRSRLVAVLDTANKTQPCTCGNAYWASCFHPGAPSHSQRRADAVLPVVDEAIDKALRDAADWLEGIGQHHSAEMLRYYAEDDEPGKGAPAAEEQTPPSDPRYRVTTEAADRYLRSSTGVLHLRADMIGGGKSDSYSRCGVYFPLGREAIPLKVGEGARVCIRCHRSEG